MKFLLVLASVVLAINAATDQELWMEFKETHGREYRNLRGRTTSASQFSNKICVPSKNTMKVPIADQYWKLKRPSSMYLPNLEAPAEVNWVNKGVVTGVKNQGSCGSCWSFSATGALEGAYAVKHGSLISLSEQNLMDCSTSYGNNACNGGLMEYAYKYVHDYGIETEKDYPYTAKKGTCQYSSSKKTAVKVTGYSTVTKKNEASLATAVANQPVAVAVNAQKWQHYAGGIFDDSSCSQSIDHGVLAVGYATSGSTPYWLIKNSWGTSWGEKGYIRLVRNKNNQCGVVNDATVPSLS
ncbi:hypothetical protein NQ314_012783 [Rhamnusium bicolor]|uniref:Peptidase C1A papain C-terminal domain-containing protein n=1 Tax=Rhamnusium bicolor TaxID=1586634 RepID=A0AAV8XAH7_9CUCU|nr:hypothetical protein NQ314_012783 [Rhamnusium bicolor]